MCTFIASSLAPNETSRLVKRTLLPVCYEVGALRREPLPILQPPPLPALSLALVVALLLTTLGSRPRSRFSPSSCQERSRWPPLERAVITAL